MGIVLHHETVFVKLTNINQNKHEISIIHVLYACQAFQESIHNQFQKLSTKIWFLVKYSSRTLCIFKVVGVFEFLGKYQWAKCKTYLFHNKVEL